MNMDLVPIRRNAIRRLMRKRGAGGLIGILQELIVNRQLFVMTVPGVLLILLFHYMPMFGILVAFKNYSIRDGILGSPWVGFDNFRFFFSSSAAARVTFNTVYLNLLMILIGITFQLTLAILLDLIRVSWFKRLSQTIMIFPSFISWVIVGFFTYGLFDYDYGFLNTLLSSFGREPVLWYNEAGLWPAILVIASLWKGSGYMAIVYLASIAGINGEYYEAAEIDGANTWQKVFRITLPNLVPIVSIMTLMAIGGIFRSDFGLFYNLPRNISTLYPTTDVIDTFVFRSLKVTGDIGMASAAGFYQSIVGFVMVVTSNLIVKRINPDNALF